MKIIFLYIVRGRGLFPSTALRVIRGKKELYIYFFLYINQKIKLKLMNVNEINAVFSADANETIVKTELSRTQSFLLLGGSG